MPVLGVIFLRHATNRYQTALQAIEAAQGAGTMPKRPLVKGDFIKRRALMLPEAARYDTLLNLPSGASLGGALVSCNCVWPTARFTAGLRVSNRPPSRPA
jgi:type I restriction enzyme M protein